MKKRAIVCLVLLAAAVQAQDKKISDLTSGSPVQATDMIPIARGGANFRLAGNDFLMWSSGTGDVPATGALGTFYYETDVNDVYTYPSTDTETWLLSLPAASGVSGGIPYFSNATDGLASSALLTANLPVIGGGAGAAPAVGTRSGNTTAYVTTTGTQTSGDCVKIDANGNHIANGSACGGGAAFNPATNVDIVEEFIGGNYGSSGSLGTHGWAYENIVSGSINYLAGAAQHPGIVRISSHVSNDNSGANLFLSPSSSPDGSINFLSLSVGDWALDVLFKPGSVANAVISIGFSYDSSEIDTYRFIRARFNTDQSDATYIFQICDDLGAVGCGAAGDNTNSTVVASSITPTAVWTRFRVRQAQVGVGGIKTIYMRINDETEKTFCASGCDDDLADLDTTADRASPTILYLTQTTTGVKTLDVDYVYFTQSGLSRY